MEPDNNVNFVKRSSQFHMDDDEVRFQNGGSLLGPSSKPPSRWSKSKVLLLISLIALFVVTMAMLLLLFDRRHYTPLWKSQPLPARTSVAPFQTSDNPAVAQTTNSQLESFRLSTSLKPLHYDLNLKTFVEENYFKGSVEITFSCLEETDVVVVHQQDLNISESSIRLIELDYNDKLLLRSTPDSYPPYSLYILRFQRYLRKGGLYALHMEFQGMFASNHIGIYRSQYHTKEGPRYVVASFLSPIFARKVFPCFDEPAFKANFSVTITHPSEYAALSNMPVSTRTTSSDSAWTDTMFETTPVMSTYLLSFAVTKFSSRAKFLRNGVELRVWCRREAISNVTFALEETEKLLLFLEEYVGFKYPLPKLDLLALPELVPSGMENWGLITFKERYMLVDERSSSTLNIQEAYFVVAHELGHQWYSNLVTQSFWDELWLKECFASLLGYIALDAVHPTWNKLGEQSFTDNTLVVMKLDAMATSHPILREITQPSQVLDNFDRVIYWKSTAVVRMLQALIGDTSFRSGMKRFLMDRAYQNAGAEDIWNALDSEIDNDALGIHIADLMRPWLQQSGYPLITLTSIPDRGKVKVEQSLFLLDGGVRDRMPSSEYDYRWDVPLTFISSSHKTFTSPQIHVLKRTQGYQTEIDIDNYRGDDWIIVNANRTGYYRVLYDQENRNRLIKQLNDNHEAISPTSRAMLIDDAFNLATAGYMNYSEVFKFTEYMSRERHHLPWTVLLSNFNYVTQMLQMTSAYGVFQDYVLQLIGPVYDETLRVKSSNATVPERLLQSCILKAACKYGYQPCIDMATEEFRRDVQTDASSIHSDFESAIWSTAISDTEAREAAFNLLRDSETRDLSYKVLTSLSSSPEPWVLSSVLEMSINTSVVKKSDAVELFGVVSANPIGRYLSWDFFRAEWDTLRDRYAGGLFEMNTIISYVTQWFNTEYQLQEMNTIISYVTQLFNTEYQLQELQNFVDTKSGQLEGAAGLSSLYAAIDSTITNIRWMNTNYGNVKTWLDNNVN